ncbi:MAG: glycosyltransferase family 9 protein, partial [Cytophagales bacterium]|nr:glycosyltransferase family 9 protein [Cytophagales bacterium]
RLAQQLPTDRFRVFITGSPDEGEKIRKEAPDFFDQGIAIDVTGKFSLTEFIGFIGACDGMVACSTGPLHIAAALGKPVAGLYPPIRPMHPGRWKPVGDHVHLFSLDKTCNDCRKSTDCACIQAISVLQIEKSILTWSKQS